MAVADTLISVIIPAYNAANTIAATLASVRAQSYARFEAIVVDDGSRDGTAELVAQIAKEDDRIRLVTQANAGVAAARNRGLAEAVGQFVAPLDADDLWHSEKLARQLVRIAEGGPAAGMVYCWSTEIDEADRVVEQRLDVEHHEGDVYATLVLHNFIGNGSVPLIRRDLLDAVGGWDPGLRARDAEGCEDWKLYLALAARADVVLAPYFLVGYRQGAGAMSRNIAAMRRSYDLVMAEARSAHPELPAALFRWSRAAFTIYAGELLGAAGPSLAAARLITQGVMLDPSWLLRRSSRRKARAFARRLLSRPGMRCQSGVSPVGMHFELLSSEIARPESDGRTSTARNRLVAAIRTTRSVI
jgi:glycosyltransferase involved in cell wall biosynthesis